VGEYWDRATGQWRDEDSGRTPADQRAYERGYERAQGLLAGAGWATAAAISPAPEHRSFTLAGPRVTAKGDRGVWQRETVAGALALAHAPDDPDGEAAERKTALAWMDDYEFTYGRRPSMEEARLAVRRSPDSPDAVQRRLSDGTVLGGTAEEIGQAFRAAGLQFAIVSEMLPLPGPGGVVHQPVRQG